MSNSILSLYDRVQESVQYIRSITSFKPEYGIILGTGLGNLTDDIEQVLEIPYGQIPHFPVSTVQSHKGKLVLGYLGGKKVLAMAGRFHYYEGYSMKQVTFPVRVMKFLGLQRLIISNVAGSTNADLEMGDIVLVRDHINLQPENPLRGPNDERLGVRFPDMSNAYDADMMARAEAAAKKLGIDLKKGVYLALQGPNLETPAEYEFIHRTGADLVGMSTVPEVIVARHSELKVMVFSIVSNKCYPIEAIRETSVEDVIALGRQTEPLMRKIVTEVLASF